MHTSTPKGIYRHYRTGNNYEIINIGHYQPNLEPVVIYRALYESPDFGKDAIWVRPLSSFLETVNHEGKTVPRFEWVGDARE